MQDRAMASLRIVDAHHHLWDPPAGYAWMQSDARKFMGDTEAVCERYEVEDLLQEVAPFELLASVHLQCGRNTQDPAEESAWVQQQAERSGLPIAIVGFANLADPGLDALLDRHAASSGFRGVRQMLNWGEEVAFRLCDRGDYFEQAAWRSGFARLGERGLSFDLQVNPWQLSAAAQVAEMHPGTALIVDHAGLPFGYRGGGLAEWKEGMRRLAALPQCSVKFSGLGMVDAQWDAGSVLPLFEYLVEQFGSGRLMFASNFPIDRLYRRYHEVYASYQQLCAGLDAAARDALFAGNAARIYRIAIGDGR